MTTPLSPAASEREFHPHELEPSHFYVREGGTEVLPASTAMTWLEAGELLTGGHRPGYTEYWAKADANSFEPKAVP